MLEQTDMFPLEISASLKTADCGGRRWIAIMAETTALLSAILRVMHPDLYRAGRTAIIELSRQSGNVQNPEATAEVLKHWSSVFTACSVISNRVTPFHRDLQTNPQWFDVLATVGNYSMAMMELPDVGLRLLYAAGTVVGISGKLLKHGVSGWAGPDRVCVASYMRPKVIQRLGVEAPLWSTWNKVLNEARDYMPLF